jgi:hypothetical protein
MNKTPDKKDCDDFLDDFVMEEDFINLKNKKTNKKINSKKKGNRVELELTKILNNRFESGFSRSVGSGNRWSQTQNLSENAKQIYSGDLVVPENFKFVIECKGGYDGIDLNSIFIHGNSEIDSFLDQVTLDSERCKRKPLLCWKQTRRPWLAFVLTKDLNHNFKYKLNYDKWSCIALEHLLALKNDFFLLC